MSTYAERRGSRAAPLGPGRREICQAVQFLPNYEARPGSRPAGRRRSRPVFHTPSGAPVPRSWFHKFHNMRHLRLDFRPGGAPAGNRRCVAAPDLLIIPRTKNASSRPGGCGFFDHFPAPAVKSRPPGETGTDEKRGKEDFSRFAS